MIGFLTTSLPISKPRIGFRAIMSITKQIFHFGMEIFVKISATIFLVNNYTAKHGDVKFIFSTMWSQISIKNAWEVQNSLGDYWLITEQRRPITVLDTNQLHRDSKAFISDELKLIKNEKAIAVTHHVPTFINYPAKYLHSSINEAFATELSELIKASTLDYWLYGHHHINTQDFKIGNTNLITNQLGYVKQNECLDFRLDAVIDL